jgi:hypothetical protein
LVDNVDDIEQPIRIEFSTRPGVHRVALSAPETLERSSRALQEAMGVVRQMAERVRRTVATMPARPSEVEVAFGIKFDAEAGAFIARTGVEASISVVFRWDRDDPPVVTMTHVAHPPTEPEPPHERAG